jgi:S-adenosylmethionine-dependent methyltransferase
VDADHLAVGRHYDEVAFAHEAARLEEQSPVERAMTERYLARYISPGAVVADIGVGAGHYDEFLASRGCRLHLADVSRRLLSAAQQRLVSRDLAACVLSAEVASATGLSHLPDECCDAVLLLGPLYHLLTRAERKLAVAEARRVLKREGLLLAAGINRVAGLRGEYLCLAEQGPERRGMLRRFLEDGLVEPSEAPTIGYAHFTTVAEFRALFAGGFDELLFVGLESFTGCEQELFADLPDPARETWLELVEATASLPEAIGCCEHFLFVGRRRDGAEA